MIGNVVIKGRLTSPTSVELDEPVVDATGDVDVIVHRRTAAVPPQSESVFEFLRRLRPSGRDRGDIDRQVRQERNAWDHET